MKVLFTHDIFSKQRYGGISRYFVNLKKNFSLEVKTLIFSGFSINKYLKETRNFGIYVPKIRGAGKIREKFNELSQDLVIKGFMPDIIHKTYYSENFPKNKLTVITVYDMIHEKYPEEFKKSENLSSIKRKNCENASHIITISNSTKKDLMDIFFVPEKKISVIYLSSDIKKENSPGTYKNPYLLYVGNRFGYKNFLNFLEFYLSNRKVNNYFDLICFGGENRSLEEKNLIHKHNSGNKVTFLRGNDTVLSNLYSNARLLVYSSLYEGFGLPILEAMNLGCPVCCFNNSSIKEVAGEAAYFIEDKKFSDLEILIFDELKLSKLRKLGYENAKKYSWNLCADETLKVYKNLN